VKGAGAVGKSVPASCFWLAGHKKLENLVAPAGVFDRFRTPFLPNRKTVVFF
jgi:hypothetical protein